MMVLKPGQVLWLRLPFGQLDEVSKIYHPYLIIGINQHGVKILEIGQLDSENGRPWDVLRGRKIPIDNLNPKESVIYEVSYLQTDRKIQIEYFDGLSAYLDTDSSLSEAKLKKTIDGYYDKRTKYGSDSFRDMYFTEEEVLKYNPIDEWQASQSNRLKKHNITLE